jgi:hypothetical protein
MYAFLFLALTALFAVLTELLLWRLFLRNTSSVHFAPPLAPRFMHVSSESRMGLLAVLHLLYTLGILCIAYLALW